MSSRMLLFRASTAMRARHLLLQSGTSYRAVVSRFSSTDASSEAASPTPESGVQQSNQVDFSQAGAAEEEAPPSLSSTTSEEEDSGRAEVFASVRRAKSVQEVKALVESVEPLEDRKEYTLVMSAYGRCGGAREALKLLEGMKDPDVIAFGAAMSGCEREGLWVRAIELLHQMQQSGVEADKIAFSQVINACKNSGQWRKAVEVMEQMPFEPDVYVVNAVMTTCARSGQYKKCIELMNNAQERGLRLNKKTYNAAVAACSRAKRSDVALEVLDRMRRDGVEPDRVTYNSAIAALCRDGKVEEAHQMAEQMPFTPDGVTYSTLISSSPPERALKVYESIETKTTSLTNSLLSSYAKNGKYEEVIEIYRKMTPDHISAMHAVTACDHLSLYQEALDLIDDNSTKREIAHAVSACLNANQMEEAQKLAAARLLTSDTYIDLTELKENVAALVISMTVEKNPVKLTLRVDKRKKRNNTIFTRRMLDNVMTQFTNLNLIQDDEDRLTFQVE